MTGFKKFLYVIYTMLFLATIGMVFYNQSLEATFGEATMYTFWMFWSLLGFSLLMLESVFENIHIWSVKRGTNRLERENTQLKARLYDLESGNRDNTVVRERDTMYRERREVIDNRKDLNHNRLSDQNSTVYGNRPDSRSDVYSARQEGDTIRVRERDSQGRIIYKDDRDQSASR
jgi:hypothetical protein